MVTSAKDVVVGNFETLCVNFVCCVCLACPRWGLASARCLQVKLVKLSLQDFHDISTRQKISSQDPPHLVFDAKQQATQMRGNNADLVSKLSFLPPVCDEVPGTRNPWYYCTRAKDIQKRKNTPNDLSLTKKQKNRGCADRSHFFFYFVLVLLSLPLPLRWHCDFVVIPIAESTIPTTPT